MTLHDEPDETGGTMTADEVPTVASDGASTDVEFGPPPQLSAAFLAESRSVCLFVLDADLRVRACNRAAQALVGRPAARLAGAPLAELLRDDSAAALAAAEIGSELGQPVVLRFVNADEAQHTRACRLQRWEGSVYLVGEPLVDRERALADALMDLHVLGRLRAGCLPDDSAADGPHWRIPKLQPHLPICAVCHRVHEAGSPWETLSAFLQRNGLRMTHGYCPDCEEAALAGLNRMYPDQKARK